MKFENIYRETEENLRLALLSLWAPGNHPMRPAIQDLFDREPLLAEPVFQSTFGWEQSTDDSWHSVINEKVWNELEKIREEKAKKEQKTFYPFIPHKHQASSWKTLKNGKSIVVTSGTGSGKTECFMYPVLSDLYEQKQQGRPKAIEAIFLYPLNALMEDQRKRLSDYCKATGLHFAVYNGRTPKLHENGQNTALSNEVATREEIRNAATRPEILLTNPSMLEYILVRQEDQQMLQESAGRLRWIVIDEAHSYSGSAAVELRYQIKRILEAFGTKAENVRFACTSATIGGGEGAQSLKEYISDITGQPITQIEVIGGNRLVPSLDWELLAKELKAQNLPSIEKVLSLREEINEVAGMSLENIWNKLCPETPYTIDKRLQALGLVDKLCEMSIGESPVLSMRAHFFMRSINGLYACANEHCSDANRLMPIYGHLTTYKKSVCSCGAPLLELVQCKRCGGFILMGRSGRQTHIISPYEETIEREDYFSPEIDDDKELDVDDAGGTVLNNNNNEEPFFLQLYDKAKFFNPVHNTEVSTFDIIYNKNKGSILTAYPNAEYPEEKDGKWVEIKGTSTNNAQSYCPGCGRLAQGKSLKLKHFRIPINFVNQTIAPVFLKECAQEGRDWGKYIAFTDSRQGTAISAKTFNIDVERIYSREKLLKELATIAVNGNGGINLNIPGLSEQMRQQILAINRSDSLSLNQVADCIFNEALFLHIAERDTDDDRRAYKAALMRQNIGRKALYEKSAESMGLITLVYPNLDGIGMPNSLQDYQKKYGGNITNTDWKNFLKICLDYYFRVGNHIQPLIDGEKSYIRDSSRGVPVAADKWPIEINKQNGSINRIVLLLCAGLGISTKEVYEQRRNAIADIMRDAWKALVENILKIVNANIPEGYNDPCYNGQYRDHYYLDLSGRVGNNVCKIKLDKKVKICPVTGNFLDTTFCGYSPFITGDICPELFERYKCTEETITMPIRPEDDDDVDGWMETDDNIKSLKESGFWSDRYKYVYKLREAYLAAEHSGQQSHDLLRKYTQAFIEGRLNVLHCSTTMEMGVDIGDIDIVLMDTIPPTAANYLQRAGRAGRQRQTKSVAFSLCNNTPVAQHAFDNPMWALETSNHMIQVRPSQTIVQRHINSYFFRRFICGNGNGMNVNGTIDDFMTASCDDFIQYLDDMTTNQKEKQRFHEVFGQNTPYTIKTTQDTIRAIQTEYQTVLKELTDAHNMYQGKDLRRLAISNQIHKTKEENLLTHLSNHQFIPNANMPTGLAAFDFIDSTKAQELNKLYKKLYDKREDIEYAPEAERDTLRGEASRIKNDINSIKRETAATRDIRTALNEYAPGQTVVVNEKNYVSAGISFFGTFNDQTQIKGIYQCQNCGHTEYKPNLQEDEQCPICGNPYHGIINKNNTTYTRAYEPIGFRTDQNVNGTREESTNKQYYDISPVLLHTDWNDYTEINMCDIASSGETGNILFSNAGKGYGFAFCKRCGRAVIEDEIGRLTRTTNNIPEVLRPGHNRLERGCQCDANRNDIARNVVFTGLHPTSYAVMQFKEEACSQNYVTDKELVYSLGVVIKRALAKSEGIDEGEIDFGVKMDNKIPLLFIYDTAKGGCGYSHRLKDTIQEVLDIAKHDLENTTCDCHQKKGACTKCLIDRNTYRYDHYLSKAKALDWLNRQKEGVVEVSDTIRKVSPSAKIVYHSLKDIVRYAINDSEVKKLTLCVSDRTDDYSVTEWTSIRSEMGKCIKDAVAKGKEVAIVVEYHPSLHTSLADKLPFIDLKSKFPDCEVSLVQDMGNVKTAIIVETNDKKRRYFTDMDSGLSFSNNWGEDCNRVYVDGEAVSFNEEEAPTYAVSPSLVVREGITHAKIFQVKKYFSTAIAPYTLKAEDIDMLSDVLRSKHVDITFSDMYVNSALASLMLVYLIKEMQELFGFTIVNVNLQLDSVRRKCDNERFNDWTHINMNFSCKEDADGYTDKLFMDLFDIDPEHSFDDASHHRWLRIETENGGLVEIRPDHGISGGYKSDSRYKDLDELDGTVSVFRNNEDVLYYVIIKKGN